MLSCREVTQRASEYLDGDLTLWSRIEVRMHLLGCRYCRGFMKQMRTVIRLVRQHGYTLPEDETESELTGERGRAVLLDAFRGRSTDASMPHRNQ